MKGRSCCVEERSVSGRDAGENTEHSEVQWCLCWTIQFTHARSGLSSLCAEGADWKRHWMAGVPCIDSVDKISCECGLFPLRRMCSWEQNESTTSSPLHVSAEESVAQGSSFVSPRLSLSSPFRVLSGAAIYNASPTWPARES